MNKDDLRKLKQVQRELELESKRKHGPQHGKAGIHQDKRRKNKYKNKIED